MRSGSSTSHRGHDRPRKPDPRRHIHVSYSLQASDSKISTCFPLSIDHDLNRLRKLDRGSQYCAGDYQQHLRVHGLQPSMSGKGNCYDNVMVETVFKTIKSELVWHTRFETRHQATTALAKYIDGFYNLRRRHSALGYRSPTAYESIIVGADRKLSQVFNLLC